MESYWFETFPFGNILKANLKLSHLAFQTPLPNGIPNDSVRWPWQNSGGLDLNLKHLKIMYIL